MGKSSVSLGRRTVNGRLLAVGDVTEVSEWALASKRAAKSAAWSSRVSGCAARRTRVLVRHLAAHLGRRLIFAQAFIDDLPQ
jgi:hypothetical protein